MVDTLLAFVAFALLVALVVGLVRPSAVRVPTRKRAMRNYGLGFLVAFIAFAATVPDTPEMIAAREAEAAEQRVQAEQDSIQQARRDSIAEVERLAQEQADWQEENRPRALVMCQQFVEDRLRSPSSAEFPYQYEDAVTARPDSSFFVASYVDSQNGFGAMIRTNYRCVTKTEDGGENWRLLELEVDG